ncbi:chitosanase [Streptomyces sp. Tu 2975]|uniref:chitosanase n=1 Tax=Streptomyces sp. Tu 2975 TaxID=2676871 RepID=UPI001ABE414E|nr:chitosanase [Streptomyces sp. Tu 2975]
MLLAFLIAVGACTACTGDDSGSGDGLEDAAKMDIAMRIVSSAENSTLDWKAQYTYIEDIGDGRGYTAGIIGFCSGTGDMLAVVERYAQARPGNALERFLPALRAVEGSDSHEGLGKPFTRAWERAATSDAAFRAAQDAERDETYLLPAVRRAEQDGLGALGQLIYFDAYVMHGSDSSESSTGFRALREKALAGAESPAEGGDEEEYLNAFLDARVEAIRKEPSHTDSSRVETAQRVFVREGNFDLEPPLNWRVYGDSYHIGATAAPPAE